MAHLAVGAEFAGYRIEALLGRGGMGIVYRARQLDLGRVVALKVVAPEVVEDEAAHTSFLAEARSAAAIEHPNVVPLYAAGDQDGIAYLVMRFIEGDDVRTLVRREGPLAPARAAAILAQAAAGVEAIHRGGLVHRDIKPANVLLDEEDHVYVTDFGLARAVAAYSSTTRSGRWAGTLHYAPPEQIRGERIDARADVYALGGVLVYMLTGRAPFDRDSDEAVLWAHLSEPPPAPALTRPQIGSAFDSVIARAMAKDPSERHATAADLARAALAAAAGEAVHAASVEAGARRRPLSRTLALAAATAGVVAGAAALVAADGGGSPSRSQSTRNVTSVATRRAQPRATQTISDVGRRPNGIVRVGNELWVTSAGARHVTRLDATTGHKLFPRPVIGRGARAIAVDRGTVWISMSRARKILGVDADTRRVVTTLATPGPPVTLAAGPSGLWVQAQASPPGGSDTILRYDREGHRLLESHAVAAGVSAIALGGGALWVAERRDRHILRLRPGVRARREWVVLNEPATALAYGQGSLWAAISTEDAVARVDPRTPTAVESHVGRRPQHLVVARGRVFVSSYIDHDVVVVDPKTARPTGRPVRTGLNPYAVAAANGDVWVTGLADGTVTRVDVR